jgi:mono/diheme cytochrome c family protein
MKIICVIAALAVLITIPLSVLSAEDGAEVFKSKCAACHGDKGEGKPAAKMPAAKGTKKTEDQIVTALLKGGDGKMIHNNPLAGITEEQAKAVAAFVKTLK